MKKKLYEESYYKNLDAGNRKSSKNKQINCYCSKRNWPKSISYETMWFLFQDVLSYTSNTTRNHDKHPISKNRGATDL